MKIKPDLFIQMRADHNQDMLDIEMLRQSISDVSQHYGLDFLDDNEARSLFEGLKEIRPDLFS